MRLVRRRGLAWREAAKAAAARTRPQTPTDRWANLLQQLQAPRPCDHPTCRGGHLPGENHNIPTIRRESRAVVEERKARQEEEFRGFTKKLLVLLAILLAALTALVLYTLLSSPNLLPASAYDYNSDEQPAEDT
ncbi:hypothetical protein O3P69_013684 [Scylla paramamosain]|uniref:Uncharacterized protein n=1 Tax=Scylla paramamosain TaxID=85552 RepID=A0AAW0SR23_SCYPA